MTSPLVMDPAQRRMQEHPDVAQVATDNVDGTSIAFVSCSEPLTPGDLRQWVREVDTAEPDELYVLGPSDDGLPEQDHLRAIREDLRRSRASYTAPGGEVESYLASLWEKELGIDKVGVDDDFFRLGGYSMLAVRIRRAVERDLGVSLPAEEIFTNGRLGDLAAIIETRKEANPR